VYGLLSLRTGIWKILPLVIPQKKLKVLRLKAPQRREVGKANSNSRNQKPKNSEGEITLILNRKILDVKNIE